MKIQIILPLVMGCFMAAAAGSNPMMAETFKLVEGESKLTSTGVKIKFVGTGSRSSAVSNPDVSSPSSHLAIYELAVTSKTSKVGTTPKQVFLSYSAGGMASHEREQFEDTTISYVGIEYIQNKPRLELRTEKKSATKPEAK
jgi:hypothetical protein